MPAVGTGDVVFVRQVHHNAGGDSFLSDIQVQRTRYLAVFRHLAGGLFEDADAYHALMYVEQRLVGYLSAQAPSPLNIGDLYSERNAR